MALSKERINIYRKFKKLGFHSTSSQDSQDIALLHRWKLFSTTPLVVTHDMIQIYCNYKNKKEIDLTIRSEYLFINLKENQTFDINNFNLQDYSFSTKNKSITFNYETINLINELYYEIMIENGIIIRKTCKTCKNNGLWENEIEYQYGSPCTTCSLRTSNNWEYKDE